MRFGKPNPRNSGPSVRFGAPQPTSDPPPPERLPVTVQNYGSTGGGGSSSEEHRLLSETHTDTEDAAPVTGDLVYADATPLWKRLAIGTAGYVLKVVAGIPAWSAWAHNLLSADDHGDTVTGTVEAGDLITGNATPKWERLARGTSGYFLKAGASVLSWAQIAFTDITGSITAAQHGNLTSTAGSTADHSGTLTANARVGVRKNSTGSTFLRRRLNIIEGTGITATVSDDSGNEEIDITIAVSGAPAGSITVEESNAGAVSGVTTLDFGSGFDVSVASNEADITFDLSEVVTGDVTFTANAAAVTKIQGAAVSDPAAGDDGQFARYNSSGDTITWETPGVSAHALLSSSHSDAATDSVSRGSLIYGNSTPQWDELVIGTANFCLRSDGTDAAWSNGVLDNNARVAVKKNGVLVATRRGVNFIEGTNITLTVADDSGNEEIDVTIDAAAGGGSTIVVQEGDSTVDAAAGTLDFAAADFNVTSSPAGEANISWQGFTVEEANSSVATDIKTLDFGAGFDVSAAGGEADITLDASEVLTGDVTYTTNAGKVTALQNISVPAPTSAEDEKALVYDHGTTAFVYRNRESQLSGGWSRNNIGTNAGTVMSRVGGGGNNINAPWIPHRAGVITGMSLATDGDIGGVGDSYGIVLYINGSNTSAVLNIIGTAGTDDSAYTLTGGGALPATFAAGDKIELYDGETGTLAAVGAQAQLFGYFT